MKVLTGDAQSILAELPEQSFHLALVDPPYQAPPEARKGGTTVRLKRWLRSDGTYFENESLSPRDFEEFMDCVLHLLSKLLVPGAWLLWFTSRWKMEEFRRWIEDDYGFVERNLLVWDKEHFGMGYYFRHQAEYIWAFTNGDTKRYVQGISNVLRVPRLAPVQITHPSEKPEALYRMLIEATTVAGEMVLDPFLGSGSSLAAALSLGRDGVGIEIEPEWAEQARRRLAIVARLLL